jgi:dynein heavy chain
MNAEEIDTEVSEMWRTVYKLTKTFNDYPGPRNVANLTKRSIDSFKEHLPLLNTICNPGIRDRHWQQVDYLPFNIPQNMFLMM